LDILKCICTVYFRCILHKKNIFITHLHFQLYNELPSTVFFYSIFFCLSVGDLIQSASLQQLNVQGHKLMNYKCSEINVVLQTFNLLCEHLYFKICSTISSTPPCIVVQIMPSIYIPQVSQQLLEWSLWAISPN